MAGEPSSCNAFSPYCNNSRLTGPSTCLFGDPPEARSGETLPPTRDFNGVKYQYEVRYDSYLCDKNLKVLSAEDVFLRQMILIERPHNKE